MDKIHICTDKRANQKINLTGICRPLIFAAAFLSLSGCAKDDHYNTPHPDQGAVKVTTDWSGRSQDATVPESYILRIGSGEQVKEQTVSGETNAFNALFAPGKQNLLVYHQAQGITISGNIATVNTLPDGTLTPMPGYLFSGARELDIVKDDTLRVTVPMQQYTRQLALALKLNPGDEQRITGTASTLTGIASAIDLTTGTLAATGGKSIALTLALGTDGGKTRAAGQLVLAATMRLLGVVTGERQILTFVITLTDGSVQTIPIDLTEALKNFGGDMEPLTWDGTLELPPDDPDVAADINATITNWNIKDNGSIEVH